MKNIKPIGLQFFADPPAPAPDPTATSAPAKADDIAAALLTAIERRTKSVEGGVAKSFAEQYGLTESEISAILDAEKNKKAGTIPAEAQQKIDAQLALANGRLIAAAVKAEGSALGLVDADAARMLMDGKDIKVNDDGTVAGVKEALDALKKTKPYLFGSAVPAKTGMRQSGDDGQDKKAAANAAFRAAFGHGN